MMCQFSLEHETALEFHHRVILTIVHGIEQTYNGIQSQGLVANGVQERHGIDDAG